MKITLELPDDISTQPPLTQFACAMNALSFAMHAAQSAPVPQARALAEAPEPAQAPVDPTEGLSWDAIAEMIDPTTNAERSVELAGGDHEKMKRIINHYGWGTVDFRDPGLGQAVWRRRFVSSPMPGEAFLPGYIADGLIVDGKWHALMDHDAVYRTLDFQPFSNGTTIINGRHA